MGNMFPKDNHVRMFRSNALAIASKFPYVGRPTLRHQLRIEELSRLASFHPNAGHKEKERPEGRGRDPAELSEIPKLPESKKFSTTPTPRKNRRQGDCAVVQSYGFNK